MTAANVRPVHEPPPLPEKANPREGPPHDLEMAPYWAATLEGRLLIQRCVPHGHTQLYGRARLRHLPRGSSLGRRVGVRDRVLVHGVAPAPLSIPAAPVAARRRAHRSRRRAAHHDEPRQCCSRGRSGRHAGGGLLRTRVRARRAPALHPGAVAELGRGSRSVGRVGGVVGRLHTADFRFRGEARVRPSRAGGVSPTGTTSTWMTSIDPWSRRADRDSAEQPAQDALSLADPL